MIALHTPCYQRQRNGHFIKTGSVPVLQSNHAPCAITPHSKLPCWCRVSALPGCRVFTCEQEVASGALQIILEDYEQPQLDVYAVYPHRQYLTAKVRAFVDFVARLLPDFVLRRAIKKHRIPVLFYETDEYLSTLSFRSAHKPSDYELTRSFPTRRCMPVCVHRYLTDVRCHAPCLQQILDCHKRVR